AVIDIGRLPKPIRRALILGSATTALISLLSFSMISLGVLLGAPTPIQPLASYPGTNSFIAGTPGSNSAGVTVVTASARNLPSLMYGADRTPVVNATCTCPPSRSGKRLLR